MKIIHLISGGDVGGAKTHVLSLAGRTRQNADRAARLLHGGCVRRRRKGDGH